MLHLAAIHALAYTASLSTKALDAQEGHGHHKIRSSTTHTTRLLASDGVAVINVTDPATTSTVEGPNTCGRGKCPAPAAGKAGAACSTSSDCAIPKFLDHPVCINSTCQSGHWNSLCDKPDDCITPGTLDHPVCLYNGAAKTCQDGLGNSVCSADTDCLSGDCGDNGRCAQPDMLTVGCNTCPDSTYMYFETCTPENDWCAPTTYPDTNETVCASLCVKSPTCDGYTTDGKTCSTYEGLSTTSMQCEYSDTHRWYGKLKDSLSTSATCTASTDWLATCSACEGKTYYAFDAATIYTLPTSGPDCATECSRNATCDAWLLDEQISRCKLYSFTPKTTVTASCSTYSNGVWHTFPGQVSQASVVSKSMIVKQDADCTIWETSPCTFNCSQIYWSFSSYSELPSPEGSLKPTKSSSNVFEDQCAVACSVDSTCDAYLVEDSTGTGKHTGCHLYTINQGSTITGGAAATSDAPFFGKVKAASVTAKSLVKADANCDAKPPSFGDTRPSACPLCADKTYYSFPENVCDSRAIYDGCHNTGVVMTADQCQAVCSSRGSHKNQQSAQAGGTEPYCDAYLLDTDGNCWLYKLIFEHGSAFTAGCEPSANSYWYGKLNYYSSVAPYTVGNYESKLDDQGGWYPTDGDNAGCSVNGDLNPTARQPGSSCSSAADCDAPSGLLQGVCAGGFCQKGFTDDPPYDSNGDAIYVPDTPRSLCNQDSDCTSSVCMDWDTAKLAHGTLRDNTLAATQYYFGTCANPFEVEAVNINRRLNGAVNHIATAIFKVLDTKPPVIPDTIAIDKTPLSYSDRDCVIEAFGACVLYFEYGVSFSINQAFNLQSVGLGIGLGAIGGSIFNGTNDFKHGETMDIALELKGSPYVSVTGNGYVSADGAKDSVEIDVTGHLDFDALVKISGTVKKCTKKLLFNQEISFYSFIFDEDAIHITPVGDRTDWVDLVIDSFTASVDLMGITFPIPFNFGSIATELVDKAMQDMKIQEKVTVVIQDALDSALSHVNVLEKGARTLAGCHD